MSIEFQAPEAEMEEASAIMTPAQMVIIVIVAGFVFMLGSVSVKSL